MKPKPPNFAHQWRGKWRHPAVVARFTKMWHDGALLYEIGDVFGLTTLGAVSNRARKFGFRRRAQRRMPRRTAAVTSPRKCLVCGEDFPSEGPGHRTCGGCKAVQRTARGGLEEYSLPAGMRIVW